jgi:hypothetical protein
MKNLIVKPNKQKNPHSMPYKLLIVAPQLLQWASTQELLMMSKTEVGEEAVRRMDRLAQLLKEIRGGGRQRNE